MFPASLLPIIAQMHDAADNRARADILLRVDDITLSRFGGVFRTCCDRMGFDAGAAFVDLRLASLRHVRNARGLLPEPFNGDLMQLRGALADYAEGARL